RHCCCSAAVVVYSCKNWCGRNAFWDALMLKQLLRLCFELVKRSPSSNLPGTRVSWHRRATRRAGTLILIAAADPASAARGLGQAWLWPRSRLALARDIVAAAACQVGLGIDVSAWALLEHLRTLPGCARNCRSHLCADA